MSFCSFSNFLISSSILSNTLGLGAITLGIVVPVITIVLSNATILLIVIYFPFCMLLVKLNR